MEIRAIPILIQGDSHSFPFSFPMCHQFSFPWDSQWEWESWSSLTGSTRYPKPVSYTLQYSTHQPIYQRKSRVKHVQCVTNYGRCRQMSLHQETAIKTLHITCQSRELHNIETLHQAFQHEKYNKKAVLSQRWPRDRSWGVAEIWPFEIIHLEFIRIKNSAIKSAVPENPTL